MTTGQGSGRQWVLGAMVAAAALAGSAAASASAQPPAQLTVPTATQQQQQQSIPDAPKPQALPAINSITPVAPAIPDAPVATAGSTPTPAASASAPAAQTGEPSVPAPGNGDTTGQSGADTQEVVNHDAFTIRTTTNFVEVPFAVKDSKGQLVPGLKPRDVQVFENGLRQQITRFTADPFPLSVALVIDQSVTYDTMKKINTALSALQGAFTPYDEVAVFTYNNGVREQTAFTAAQSARLVQVLERSKGKGRDPQFSTGGPLAATNNKNGINVDPNTAPNRSNPGAVFENPERDAHTLNDAVLAAAAETTKAGKGRRRIVYVISDGKEYGSKAKEREVIRYCQANNVAVYATLVGDAAVPGLGFLDRIHLPLTMRDDVLPRYAGATGGQVDPEFRPKGIENSFARITEEVRTQYTLGYNTHEPMIDGKFRKLEVRVLRPGLTVIAKDGYYPRPADNTPPPAATPVAVP